MRVPMMPSVTRLTHSARAGAAMHSRMMEAKQARVFSLCGCHAHSLADLAMPVSGAREIGAIA